MAIGSIAELASFFEEHGYFWPPKGEDPVVVPRLIVDELPESWHGRETSDDLQSLFIRIILPLVLLSNELILADRTRILDVIAAEETAGLSEQDWFRDLLQRYQLQADADLNRVLRRVDRIPPSLAIAQAILESGWGTSRFADEGNALFAEWIWGGGIRPESQRESLGDYGVESFSSLLRSAISYANNLNSNASYQEFRERRADYRLQDRLMNGCELAGTLDNYSELSVHEYSDRLCTLMRNNDLADADSALLDATSTELVEFFTAGSGDAEP